jgi:hypothetical protein
MVRIPLTWYPEPGTRHLCTILTFQILTEHYVVLRFERWELGMGTRYRVPGTW